jgi:general stress protein 26
MATDTNLQFIREKIGQLRHAVMYETGDGLIKLRNDVVTAVKVDEEGQLWFVTNAPAQLVRECEQSFPARLRFYRKGLDFSVEVSGKASIINHDYSFERHRSPKDNSSQFLKKILVKLSMMNIEYIEPHNRKPKNKMELWIENGYNWFLRTIAVHHDTGSVFKKLRQTN